MIYCGIDWAERTHDVALVDDSGQLTAKRHIADDAAGYKILLDLLAEYGDTEETPIQVAIETLRGLTHDLTAAPTHRTIRICERQGVPILADRAYQGAGPWGDHRTQTATGR